MMAQSVQAAQVAADNMVAQLTYEAYAAADAGVAFVDLRDDFDRAALERFYAAIVAPAFPMPDELDDLATWDAALAPPTAVQRDPRDPLLHVLLAVQPAASAVGGGPTALWPTDSRGRTIMGGIVVEYYPMCHCGLVSYFVVHESFRRRGLLKQLVERGCALMHSDAVAHRGTPCAAIFAETNRLGVRDGVMEPAERHRIFYSLGFQLVEHAYTQPPVSPTKAPCADLLLAVYCPLAATIDAALVLSFIRAFAYSVFGYDAGDDFCSQPWYAAQARALEHRRRIPLRSALPWPTPSTEPGTAPVPPPPPPQRPVPLRPAYDVAVVGGGIAGLACASRVAELLGPDHTGRVVLLEANSFVGGRLFQVRDEALCPWPVALGAEFVHGSRSVLRNVLAASGLTVHGTFDLDAVDGYMEPGGAERAARFGRIYYDGSHNAGDGSRMLPLSQARDSVPAVREAMDAWRSLSERFAASRAGSAAPLPDVSLLEYAHQAALSPAAVRVLEAVYVQTWASSTDRFGLREGVREEADWCYGPQNYRCDGSYAPLVDLYRRRCDQLGVRVLTDWPAVRIAWWPADTPGDGPEAGAALVDGTEDRSVTARRCAVCVPLSVLRDGDVMFEPPLPERKRLAIERIDMQGAVKVCARFSRVFWPPDTALVYCPGAPHGQLWMDVRAAAGAGEPIIALVTGFSGGFWRTRAACGRSGAQLVTSLVRQLDALFGTAAEPRPASAALVHGIAYDWNRHPFVRGAYTSPTVGASQEDRTALAAPVGAGTLCFAGEAFHPTQSACVQHALETGLTAAEAIAHSLAAAASSTPAAQPRSMHAHL